MPAVFLLIGVLFTVGGPGAADQVPPPQAKAALQRWSLARFEKEALKRHPSVHAALADVKLALGKRMQAAWARFPRFEWTSTVTPIPALEGNVFMTRTPTNQFLGFDGIFHQHKLDIFAPLFTFGKIRNAQKAAKAGVQAAEHNVDRARQKVIRDVRKAFYSVKVAEAVMKIIHEGWKRLTAADKKLEDLLEKGSKEVEELDKNRLRTFSAEVSSRRQEAIRFAKLSTYALRVAAGIGQERPIEAERRRLKMVKISVPPLDTLIRHALAERPGVKALDAAVRARQAAAALRRSYYWPDFFLAGTVGVARCNVCTDQTNPFVFDPFNLDLYGAAVGVRLTLDYPQKIALVRQADAEHAKLVAQRNLAIEGIRLQVRNAYLRWQQVKEQKRIVTKGRKAAQGWLFQSTINFNTGLSKLKDLTDALASWFKFRLQEIRAVYDYNVAVSELEYAVGKALPRTSK